LNPNFQWGWVWNPITRPSGTPVVRPVTYSARLITDDHTYWTTPQMCQYEQLSASGILVSGKYWNENWNWNARLKITLAISVDSMDRKPDEWDHKHRTWVASRLDYCNSAQWRCQMRHWGLARVIDCWFPPREIPNGETPRGKTPAGYNMDRWRCLLCVCVCVCVRVC